MIVTQFCYASIILKQGEFVYVGFYLSIFCFASVDNEYFLFQIIKLTTFSQSILW